MLNASGMSHALRHVKAQSKGGPAAGDMGEHFSDFRPDPAPDAVAGPMCRIGPVGESEGGAV
jgi:hypothetical protein